MTHPNGQDMHVRRTRSRAVLFGLLSLIVASGTAYVAFGVVSRYEQQLSEVQQVREGMQVVLAASDLRPGTVIGPDDVRLGPAPAGVPMDRLFIASEGVIGQTMGDRTLAGEPIRHERLTLGGADLGVNEVIDFGSRAVTIRAAKAAAVGGLLRPGYFVDVIVTIRPESKELDAEWVTETILQGVRVIAVGDAVSSSPSLVEESDGVTQGRGSENYVTLEVEPAEAEEIALASTRGQLHLALRARDDFRMLDPGSPLVTNALLGLPDHVQEAQEQRLSRKRTVSRLVAAPDLESMEVIRGTRVSVEEFDQGGTRVHTRSPARN